MNILRIILLLFTLSLLNLNCYYSDKFYQIDSIDVDSDNNYYIITKLSGKSEIKKLDKEFNLFWNYSRCGKSESELYHAPFLTIDDKRNIYVSNEILSEDTGSFIDESIMMLSSDGKFIKYILKYEYTDEEMKDSQKHHVFWVHDIDSSGNMYISNFSPPYNVWKINTNKQPYIRTKNLSSGTDNIQYLISNNIARHNICQIKLGFYDDFFIADQDDNCIKHYNLNGELLNSFGSEGNSTSQFYTPMYIAISGSNQIIVSDMGNQRIQIFSYDGQFQKIISAKVDEKDVIISGVVINPDNEIVVADEYNGRILFFNYDGTLLRVVDETKKYFHLDTESILLLVFVLVIVITIYLSYKFKLYKRVRFPIIIKQILLFVPLLCLSSYIVGYIIYSELQTKIKEETHNDLKYFSESIAKNIDIDKFTSITKSTQCNSNNYKDLYDNLFKTLHGYGEELHNPKYHFTTIRNINKINYIVIDEYRRGINQPFALVSDNKLDVSNLNKVSNVEFTITGERPAIGGIAPIYDNHNIVGYIIIYTDRQILVEVENIIKKKLFIMGIIIISLGIVIFVFFSFVISVPLRKLRKNMLLVELRKYIPVKVNKRKDEIEDLMLSFNKMIIHIKEYISTIEVQKYNYTCLSQDIHDRVSGRLSTIKRHIEILIASVLKSQSKDDTIIQLKKALDYLQLPILESRNMIFVLQYQDTTLEQLKDQIKFKVITFTNLLNLKIQFVEKLEDLSLYEIKPGIVLDTLGIIDEVLNNIAKHSNATSIEVQIVVHKLLGKNLFEICIADDGLGFEIENKLLDNKSGLKYMNERTSQMDASIEFISNPCLGTKIILRLPLN